MRLRHRRDDHPGVEGVDDDRRAAHAERDVDLRRDDVPMARDETVETVRPRWDVASMLAVAAGVALVVIGAIALVRAEIDSSWYDPVVSVLGADHTALLGGIEVGVGAVLIVAGLAGARAFAALVALLAGIGAAIAAIEPELVDRELALDRWWAVALAVGGILLALILAMAPGRTIERRVEHRRPMTA